MTSNGIRIGQVLLFRRGQFALFGGKTRRDGITALPLGVHDGLLSCKRFRQSRLVIRLTSILAPSISPQVSNANSNNGTKHQKTVTSQRG